MPLVTILATLKCYFHNFSHSRVYILLVSAIRYAPFINCLCISARSIDGSMGGLGGALVPPKITRKKKFKAKKKF